MKSEMHTPPEGGEHNRNGRTPGKGRSVLISLFVVTVFVAGAFVGRTSPFLSTSTSAENNLESQPAFSTFENVWDLVHDQYVDPDAIVAEDLLYAATRGMMEELGDRGHTSFLDPEDATAFRAAIQGELIGIGVRLSMDGAFPEIVMPISGSPAEEAGIRRGDLIIEIEGVPTQNLTEAQISTSLKGSQGEALTLTLLRPDSGEEIEVTLVRKKIELDPVVTADLPGGLLLIRLTDFSSGAARELEVALDSELNASVAGLILDLRSNPGGLVHEAIAVASEFMTEGRVVYLHDQRGDDPRPVRTVGIDGRAYDIPMVVLVDENSASAAEIIATTLHDNHRATIVGQTTFGTGTVVSSFELEDGSIAAIGTAYWRSPNGELYWNEGFTPEIQIELPEDGEPMQFDEGDALSGASVGAAGDTQLARAIEILAPGLAVSPPSEIVKS